MRGDLKFLEKTFDKFNKIIFKEPLPKPMMHISSARSFMGQFKAERHGIGRQNVTYHLTLSNRFDMPEEVLEDTVIHEMIHFQIFHAQLRDSSSHGPVFRQLMNEINRRFNRHITVSHRCTQEQIESDKKLAHSIVCLCTMTDGRRLFCKVSQSKVFEIHREFTNWDKVASQEWYWVFGSYFNRFRRILTPKLFQIDEEGISKIQEGTRLEFSALADGRQTLQPER